MSRFASPVAKEPQADEHEVEAPNPARFGRVPAEVKAQIANLTLVMD